MSLASRIANIIVPPQSTHPTPSDSRTTVDITNGSEGPGSAAYKSQRNRRSTETGIMETEEEEGRPRYLHVGSDATGTCGIISH